MKIDLRTAAYASIVLGALSLAACASKGETTPDAPASSSSTPSSARPTPPPRRRRPAATAADSAPGRRSRRPGPVFAGAVRPGESAASRPFFRVEANLACGRRTPRLKPLPRNAVLDKRATTTTAAGGA
ncbi:hypothetical protein FE772_21335 [Lysobacter enzymogenes]|nr:hypothetical protein [Lysobacter enzymogenes]QCW27807.1 hypothetical protein FE772_21335 [Lysobacter enzymogenes]